MLRSIIAIVCGSMVIAALSLSADAVLMGVSPESFSASGRSENSSLLMLTLVYSAIFSVLGGYVAAWVAKRQELKHALALGLWQLVLSTLSAIQFSETAPLWWHAIFLLLIVPAIWCGGYLRLLQTRRIVPSTV